MTPFFIDIGKRITDLLFEDFLVSQTLKLKTKSATGVQWKSEGEISSKNVQGSLSASFHNSLGLSLETLRVKSDGRVLMEASWRTSEYMKYNVSAEDGRQELGRPLHSFGRLGVEYTDPNVSFTSSLDVVNGPTVRSTLLVKLLRGLSIGGESTVNSHLDDKGEIPEVTGLNVGLAYVGQDWEGYAKCTDLLGKLHVGYLHHASPAVDVCGIVDYDLKSNFQKLTFGSQFRLDDKSVVKVKADSTAVVSASFQQRLSEHFKLTLSSQANAIEWSQDSIKFGIGLSFE